MRIGRMNGIGSGFGVERRVLGRRVEPIDAAARPGHDRDRDLAGAPGRALVAITPAVAGETHTERLVRWRAHAPFLAQLIATREEMPETRRLRRTEPRLAARAYADAMDGVGLLVPGYLVDALR